MKKEDKIIFITMILNFWVAIIKLSAGIVFSFSTLIADSVQSFTDFITDITSLIANRIGRRRANKTYPFGYGQVYGVANLFTGALLFLIGIFITYQFFFFEGHVNPNKILYITILVVLFLKGIIVYLLRHYGSVYKNEVMVEAAKESKADFISTCVVLLISILVVFERYFPIAINIDKIGSLGMAIYVFVVSIKMIASNIEEILTNSEENDEIKEEVANELKKFEKIELKQLRIIKMSAYYSVFLKLKVDENITIKEFLEIEKKIKTHLKSKNKQIRFIDIEPV